MQDIKLIILLLPVSLLPASTFGEDKLPRVLILGDSLYQEPARSAANELKLNGSVELVYATVSPGEARNTETALKYLDALLGEGEWDLIHFNFGLGDLIYRAPGLKSFRAMAKESGGVRTTGPAQYEKNLRELVQRLKATGARLVWASTTPIRSSPHGIFDLGSEKQYNAIAAKIMAEHNIPINDMYAHVTGMINMDRPTAFDPFSFDKKPLHPPIVRRILQELNLPPTEKK